MSRDIYHHLPSDETNLEQYSPEGNQPFVDETERHSEFNLLVRDRQTKALPVDRTLDSDSNGMHNSILAKCLLELYVTEATNCL